MISKHHCNLHHKKSKKGQDRFIGPLVLRHLPWANLSIGIINGVSLRNNFQLPQ